MRIEVDTCRKTQECYCLAAAITTNAGAVTIDAGACNITAAAVATDAGGCKIRAAAANAIKSDATAWLLLLRLMLVGVK